METKNLVLIQEGNKKQIKWWNKYFMKNGIEYDYIGKVWDENDEDRLLGRLMNIKGLNAERIVRKLRSFIKGTVVIHLQYDEVIEL